MRALIRKLMRYAVVSVISTTVSLTVLGLLIATATMSAGWANLVATGIGTIPSFELNRRWVWHKTGERSLFAEIAPFCALSFLGLGLSTIAVSIGTSWAARAGFGPGVRALVADAAN